MRDYAKLAPTFWTGKTGRALKRRGIEGVIVALYLVSSPHSNMLGLYYQPKLYLAEETGLPIEGASKGLQDCIDVGFCSYDDETKTVWVHEMAAWQVAEELSQGDKRCKGIQKDYDALPDNPFLGEFFDRYESAFHLTKRREFEGDDTPEVQAPSKALDKPHRSQEQEQEQEQAQEQEQEKARKRATPPERPPEVSEQVWTDWLQLRKAKRAPVTATVLESATAEAGKARMSLEAFLRVWCGLGWQGLTADRLPADKRVNGHNASEPAWRTEQRDRMQAFAGPAAAKRPDAQATIDMEATDATARLVG